MPKDTHETEKGYRALIHPPVKRVHPISKTMRKGVQKGRAVLLANQWIGFNLFLFLCTFPLETQPTPPTVQAVFIEGPRIGRGLPYLSPNPIPYEQAVYLYRDTRIPVYFIRQTLPVLESWSPIRCGAQTFYQVSPGDPEALLALSPLGFSVLLALPDEPWRCLFLETFLNRVSSFYQNLGSQESPFPAFIETRNPSR
ncbi:MAG: hypothetical protein SNJ78_00345 [Spirochaetales bacterium]